MSIMNSTQIIEIPTDPTNLSTECIGISSSTSQPRRRGRPKGSKSKSKRTTGRKRSAAEYNNDDENNKNLNNKAAPNRKKRKPNKSHRDAYPHYTDEDIRRQLSMERKAKNRKSAQESRERRRRQEAYLNDRLPKGLALKRLLLSDKMINSKNENIDDYASSDEEELSEMRMIIDQMADNYASDYDSYSSVVADKSMISDSLIIDVLKQYVNPLKHEEEDSDNLVLETDTNPIHIQVIQEIEEGIPMKFDQIPKTATPNAYKINRGRKRKQQKIKKRDNDQNGLKTPENMPTIIDSSHHSSSQMPPAVFGADNMSFNIGSESAVSQHPLPRDSMLNTDIYTIRNVYNNQSSNREECVIKSEKELMEYSKFPIIQQQMYNHAQQNNSENTQTPSIISTNSTISTHSDQSRAVHPNIPYSVDLNVHTQAQTNQSRFRIPSLQTHTTMNQSPNTMHCNNNLHHSPMFNVDQITLHSPIIHTHTTNQEQDMEETKQILLTQTTQSGKNFSNGNNLNNLSNNMDEVEDEIKILDALVKIVQAFIVIICGMRMMLKMNTNQSMDSVHQRYQPQMDKVNEDLMVLVMNFIKHKLMKMSQNQWMNIQIHLVQHYLPEIVASIKCHPLLPTTNAMGLRCHYQAYRQIAMEILQNMKQQLALYQTMTMTKHQMMTFDARPIPVYVPLTKTKMICLDRLNCVAQNQCSEQIQMIRRLDYSQIPIHSRLDPLIKSKQILQEKCFKILLSPSTT